jgi:hypothetical protein
MVLGWKKQDGFPIENVGNDGVKAKGCQERMALS